MAAKISLRLAMVAISAERRLRQWKKVSSTISMLLLGVAASSAFAIDDRANIEPNEAAPEGKGIAWKLTPSFYHDTAARSAFDLNLRGNLADDVFWVGQYQRGSEFQQLRTGYEHQFALPFGKIIASAQYATRGFLGSSATLELSDEKKTPFFALAGFGRTNLQPYYNLNFDPNDSILLGGGWRPDQSTALTLFQVRDDRLHTGQRVTHLVLRTKTGEKTRMTVDLFQREGRSEPDAEFFRGTGVALTIDYAQWFARLAVDPKANYTNSNMTRAAVGMRF